MRKVVSTVGQPESEVFSRLHARAKARASGLGLDYEWRPRRDGVASAALVGDACAAIVDVEPYDASTLAKIAPTAQLLVRFGVGYDSVDVEAAAQMGIKVGRTPGGNAKAVAEMALLLMLASRRGLTEHSASVRSGVFQSSVTLGLNGATVGIVGFGAVGRAVRRLLAGFGCTVIVHAPSLSAEEARACDVLRVSLEELARQSDVVTLHVPATPATHHLVSRDFLKCMRPTATLVNTSRGAVIDETALVEAVQEGWIGGAGLDVFATEPLPVSSPLLAAQNIIVTPHCASQTEQALSAMFDIALDVVEEVLTTGQSRYLLTD